MSVHFVLLFEIYQKPLSFRLYVEFRKVFTFIIAERKVSENRFFLENIYLCSNRIWACR